MTKNFVVTCEREEIDQKRVIASYQPSLRTVEEMDTIIVELAYHLASGKPDFWFPASELMAEIDGHDWREWHSEIADTAIDLINDMGYIAILEDDCFLVYK